MDYKKSYTLVYIADEGLALRIDGWIPRVFDASNDFMSEPNESWPPPERFARWRNQSRKERLKTIKLFKRLNLPILPAYIKAHEELEREAQANAEIPPAIICSHTTQNGS